MGDFQGDGMQLGATFMVAKGGQVAFEHRQQHFGDFPVLDEVGLCVSLKPALVDLCEDER